MVGLATFIAARQGGRIVVDDKKGYHYKHTSTKKKGCRDKTAKQCDAKAILIDKSGIIKSVNPNHTHGNRFVKNKVRAFVQKKYYGCCKFAYNCP